MYRRPGRPSPSALRSAATLTLRLLSSTMVLGQTRATSSSLLTSSPGRSTRPARISTARLPRRTGVSPSSKSCRAGKRRKGPNEKQGLVEGAGQSAIFLTWLHLFLLTHPISIAPPLSTQPMSRGRDAQRRDVDRREAVT